MNTIQHLLNPERLRGQDDDELAHDAVLLAAELLAEAKLCETPTERAQAAKIARMMDDPNGKAMTMAMSDQMLRSHKNSRRADQLNYLVGQFGVPKYLGGWEQNALWLGSLLGEYIPAVVMPFVVAKLRQDTRNVILPSEEQEFKDYVRTRRAEGVRLNLNQLGEAILGEEEAARRLDAYLKLLARDDVEYISVKISSIFSQINLIAFEDTVRQIETRLRTLYRTAMQHRFVPASGESLPKFVNLDMEEYRDLNMTVTAFKRVLDEDEFKHYRAGIVLQAYLPDAHVFQRELTEWAMRRVASGGACIKVRIVKGANLAMERVEAELHDWQQAPYKTKPEVDANYKRMVIYGMQPAHARAVNLGIASHNLFDVAYALLLRAKYAAEPHTEMEMLEGMANHQARTVKDAAGSLLLYAPVVKREDFHSAISYLVRRLDENTSPENFLHDLFGLDKGSPAWERQAHAFLESVRERDQVLLGAQRPQNRATENILFDGDAPFQNVADTDWSLPHNVAWVKTFVEKWREAEIDDVTFGATSQRMAESSDPSTNRLAYRYALASVDEIYAALDIAVGAQTVWRETGVAERKRILLQCAHVIAARRGDFIGAMMRDSGKAIPEADAEISEAIDFANYYARAFDEFVSSSQVSFSALGTVLVTPPWNFPLAIPAGGVLAALMAGNTVILKPAPETVLTAWQLCNALWDAGVPRSALQFLPTSDDDVGKSLVTDARVNAVILTGAYATARLFLSWKPSLRLFAETSGKNAMIVTGMADHDSAIKDLVKSAFGHAGQKCSAASLAVLEAEVYDNPSFLKQLRDAAASVPVGGAWDLGSGITPVIREPSDTLRRGLTQLDEGESWLLQPRQVSDNPNLWSPGIKLGVKRGGWYHRNECFGPVLGLMRADDLDDAISMVNDNDFGLTSGLQSLDDREQAIWRESIQAGNLYINRGTTGAIVQRQPFGGWKRSVFGEAKAGGPNYVWSLGTWRENTLPTHMATPSDAVHGVVNGMQDWLARTGQIEHIAALVVAAGSYAHAWQTHFNVEHDPSNLKSESNVFRYRPIKNIVIRVARREEWLAAMQAVLAAQTCGVAHICISVLPGAEPMGGLILDGIEFDVEDEASYAVHIAQFERVRDVGSVALSVRESAIAAHALIVDAPVLAHGRLELRHYVREQSVTTTMHRYGNLIERK